MRRRRDWKNAATVSSTDPPLNAAAFELPLQLLAPSPPAASTTPPLNVWEE